MKTSTALIALGSNLGNSREIFSRVIDRLQTFSTTPVVRSSLWQTTPVDCPPDSPIFLNSVVAIQPLPNETPESLLQKLQALEKQFGRQPKKILNEARPLDLDLIAFASETRNTSTLILPHPRAHERRFVLAPLNEIAPNLILPNQTQTIAQLLSTLPPDAAMRRLS